MVARVLFVALPIVALALIGWGAWWCYAPAGPLSVGLLLWLDLSRKDRAQ